MFDKLISNRLFWLLILVFLLTLGLWVRPSLFGFDGYATASAVRYGWFDVFPWQPFANIVFDLLPDSLFVFKLIMFLSIFCSVVPIWLLVMYFYDERSAWISVFLLLSLSPIILYSFGEFENELFAYPLIVWGVYYFLTGRYVKSFILGLFSLGFWLWAAYVVRGTFFSSSTILELQPLAGVINFWFLIPFLGCISLIKIKRIRFFGVFFVLLWFWNPKLFVFLLPFVALGIAEALTRIQNSTNKHNLAVFLKNNWNYVYILAIFCVIGVNIAYLLQQPTPFDQDLVKNSIKLSKDTNYPLYNDWDFGYWLWYEGYKTKSHPGTGPPSKFDTNIKSIILTQQHLDCNLIKKYDFIIREANIYKCN